MRTNKKPHIIIFNPDEMRADSLAHLGNPAAITPNLDGFAANDAVSFSRAYCQNPVCVPSRCSFLTGLYPHVRGHRTMSYLLHPGEETLFSELRRGGYYVWMNSRNDLLAGQIPGWAESHADEIYYGELERAPPGPENHAIRGSKGSKYYYSHFQGRLSTDETGRNYSNDDDVVDAAIKRILNPPDDRPICLFLGLMYPHVAYSVEEPYYSAIDRKCLPERIKSENCTGKAKILALIREYAAMGEFTEDDWNELRAVYLGMCMKIDAQFGRLLSALQDAGLYDDCAIFFLSDHGDFTGDYDLPEKAQNSFEDCLTRVPLLVKPPKGVDIIPGISNALTELVDFYATALDFAEVPASHTHFGRSLRKNLIDHDNILRKFSCCEGGRLPEETHCDEYHSYGANASGAPESMSYWPKLMAQTDNEAHAKGIMIRNDRYKYVSRVSDKDELYDLVNDPGEAKNLFLDPNMADVIISMRKDMLKWLQETSDIVPFEYDQRFTPDMALARLKNITHKEDEAVVRKMLADGVSFVEITQHFRDKGGG